MNYTASERDALALLAEIDGQAARVRRAAETAPERQARTDAGNAAASAEAVKGRAAAARRTAKQRLDEQADKDDALRARVKATQARLDSGEGLSRELVALQKDLATLQDRLAEEEDEEMVRMEELDAADEDLSAAETTLSDAQEAAAAATAALESRLGELKADHAALMERRTEPLTALAPPLAALYEQVRASVGTGAARFEQGRCGGCGVELAPAEIHEITAKGSDVVIQCEDCERILLR